MKLTNVRGIVWDLDGTLLDSFSIFEKIIEEIALERGHQVPSHEDLIKNYHGSLEEIFEAIMDLGSSDEVDAVVRSFVIKQDIHYDTDLDPFLFQDATTLAKKAAKLNFHQSVVTNRHAKDTGSGSPRVVIAKTVLADCIHEVWAADEVEFRKPDKRSLGDWLERNKLDARDVIVIGDQFVDAQLAVNIGSRAVLVNRHIEIPHLEKIITKNPKDIVIVDSLDDIELN